MPFLTPSPLLGGRVPLLNRLQKKKGSLVLNSLLEDLDVEQPCSLDQGHLPFALGFKGNLSPLALFQGT